MKLILLGFMITYCRSCNWLLTSAPKIWLWFVGNMIFFISLSVSPSSISYSCCVFSQVIFTVFISVFILNYGRTICPKGKCPGNSLFSLHLANIQTIHVYANSVLKIWECPVSNDFFRNLNKIDSVYTYRYTASVYIGSVLSTGFLNIYLGKYCEIVHLSESFFIRFLYIEYGCILVFRQINFILLSRSCCTIVYDF